MSLLSTTPGDVVRFVELGGAVMLPLLVLGLLMWTSLLLRWFDLLLRWRGPVEQLVDELPEGARGILPRAAAEAAELSRSQEPLWRLRLHFQKVRQRIQRGGLGTDMMIAAAPLLGLLGTITGMIDTFEVIGLQQGAGYSEAMARGISKALITTEFGLSLSIPGILVSRALRRRQARLVRALDELEARFASRSMEEAPC